MTDERFQEADNRLYSQAAIAIATYLGGPIAAGALMRRNFINLGQEQWGKHAFFFGFVATVLVFLGIFLLPDAVIDKIPDALIPAIYTGIVFLFVERIQGPKLKEHKESNGPFFSKWRAAGIGSLYMLGLLAIVFAFVFWGPDDFDTKRYDQGISEFIQNEEDAMEVFYLIEMGYEDLAMKFIPERGIPLWKENIQIVDDLSNIDGLYPDLKKQLEKLRQYSLLRIKSLELILQGMVEETDAYEFEIDNVFMEINTLIDNM
jgi:hypothetical protein